MTVTHATDTSFEEVVIKAKMPVVVDFWAEWCGPCRTIAPFLDEISKELDSKVQVVKVNIDQNPETPTKYGVRGIPTLMLFRDGAVSATKVGALPKHALQQWIEQSIGTTKN